MLSAVTAFFHRIVDYAGIFPPARLPLAEAVNNYVRYRSGPHAWMLGRFIIPAARLDELDPHLKESNAGKAMQLSATLRPDHLREDLLTLHRYAAERSETVDASNAECRLPGDAVDRAAVSAFLHEFDQVAGDTLERVFFEIPGNSAGTEAVWQVGEGVAAYNDSAGRWKGRAGIKIRCGGATAEDVPDVRFVSDVIATCTQLGLRYKATAGLHHPVRNVDRHLNTEVFGFLNVFGAGVLAAVHRLPAGSLHPILLEDDPSKFDFGPGHFSWGEYTASVSWIQGAREKAIVSFGSCSFDEPVEDLKKLRLI